MNTIKKLQAGFVLMLLVVGLVGTANATLMDVGNGLVYDNSINKVWLGDRSVFNGSSGFYESFYRMQSLQNTVTLNGDLYNLTWRIATRSEMGTLDFFQPSYRELFTPTREGYELFYNKLYYVYFISGAYGGVISWAEYGGPDIYEVPYYNMELFINVFTGNMFNNPNDPNEWSDSPQPLSVNRIFAIADLQPVPEPSTIVLLGTGLIALAAYGRKRSNK